MLEINLLITHMEAINRAILIPDWLTVMLFSSFILLVFLKALNPHKFFTVVSSIVNKGFLEIESEEKISPFNLFNLGFTLFSLSSISLAVYFSFIYIQNESIEIESYYSMVLLILVYMTGRFLIEFLIMNLFSVKSYLNVFFLSKRIYLFSISIGIWIFVLLYAYGEQSIFVLWAGSAILFCIRLLSILSTNKNLIFNNLFYFILYLCSFEIAPLLILYKVMTK